MSGFFFSVIVVVVPVIVAVIPAKAGAFTSELGLNVLLGVPAFAGMTGKTTGKQTNKAA